MSTFLTFYFIVNSFLAGYWMASNTDDMDFLDSLFMFLLIMWFATLFIILYYSLNLLIYLFKGLKKIFYDQDF
jgi:hypothetical protein